VPVDGKKRKDMIREPSLDWVIQYGAISWIIKVSAVMADPSRESYRHARGEPMETVSSEP